LGAALSALLGAVEAGGTKFICVAARDAHTILAERRIDTTTPAATLGAALDFFATVTTELGSLAAIGIASFGPVDLRASSPSFGRMLATPKPGWTDVELVARFATRFACPVAVDTDVNAAALAENMYGAARGCDVAAYVTVGTGIGGGIVVHGRTVRGALHPEMGHIRVLRHEHDRKFEGTCPFHGDCLEGLASGTAIRARYGVPLDRLPPNHGAPGIVGYYLGQLAANLVLLISPQRLVFGGGVMAHHGLLDELRSNTAQLLNGYGGAGSELRALEALIVAPGLSERSGIIGALALAEAALHRSTGFPGGATVA
jgi:fructokinase